jgi:GNAT superfamily N-acetyltransferase
MPDMLVRLYDLPDLRELIGRLAGEGVDVRRALAPERHVVVDWVERTFGKSWASETRIAFANAPVSCHVAIENEACIGFGCYDTTCRGFFGPTGVALESRGRGIGKALLWATLDAMWEVGYGYAIIGGAGPTAFYEKNVGAVAIEGSIPGIYRNMLKEHK